MTRPAVSVDVERLGRRFGDRHALRDVSFAVVPGEMTALLGPNGGGKTTLFRILATLLRPTSGDARVFGHSVVTSAGPARRRMGVVFQRPSLDLKLTVAENLAHHGRLYGLSGRCLRERAAASLDKLGLAGRAGDRAERLSGGLQRRAELAKALMHEPDLLLLDEPSTGLDPNVRREVLDHLEGIARAGGTVLMTTHFMDEAERCGKVGILHEGMLAAFDTPDRLKGRIHGDVVRVHGRDPAALGARIRERFRLTPSLVDGWLRLETQSGHLLAAQVVEAFPEEISSVTWGRPTLDDVFVGLTGRRLGEAAA
ncbi:MAG TPA: ABC transporter ATP-binding protein [Candidatus Polarisedimenticolia bacterium]|nr:ABC transporter ATP-binding protein [Candidatus Polarisedimenticolia bacterium]